MFVAHYPRIPEGGYERETPRSPTMGDDRTRNYADGIIQCTQDVSPCAIRDDATAIVSPGVGDDLCDGGARRSPAKFIPELLVVGEERRRFVLGWTCHNGERPPRDCFDGVQDVSDADSDSCADVE